MTTPQQNAQNARLEQIKRSWQQKRQIGERLDKIKTKIGVYSGKGGVGKTTVAVNLAVTLAKEGARVGILDVDIDCPNVTNVLAASARPEYVDGQIIPRRNGVSRWCLWLSSRRTRKKQSSGAAR